MMCSHGSLNAVKMLGPSYNLLPKYASDFDALRSLISLYFGRARAQSSGALHWIGNDRGSPKGSIPANPLPMKDLAHISLLSVRIGRDEHGTSYDRAGSPFVTAVVSRRDAGFIGAGRAIVDDTSSESN